MLCFLCKRHQADVNSLIKHFKLVHGVCSGKTLRLVCGQRGCSQVYGTFSGFRKHLNSAHNVQCSDLGEGTSTTEDVTSCNLQDLPLAITPSESILVNKSLVDSCATAVAELKEAGVAETVINSLVISMEELVDDVYKQAKESVKNCLLQEPKKSEIECKIDECFKKMENPFCVLNSESKRTRFFKEKWGSVDPVEYILGTRFDTLRNRTSGGYDQVVVTNTFMYIPILKTLQFIYSHPNIKEMVQADFSQGDVLQNLCDGELFKSHPLFSKHRNAIQIQLFYDDFETSNPLGSKRGIYKVGAIYFTLRNFSPKYNSCLSNIHLVTLFHAQDIKTYGFSKILDPIVQDIKILERDGIKVPLYDQPVYGTIVQVTGDNLGLHCLFGFVESFSARYCCRFCLTEKEDFQTEFNEDSPNIVLRTQALHEEHCQQIEANPRLPYVMGVKQSCILNSLQYFKTCDNFSVDIMHDILEGVAQYEMKLILHHLIDNYTTSEEIQTRIKNFNYGYVEQANKPPEVKLLQDTNDLGLNAIQSWTLLRNLPLIFGDLVSPNDQSWYLLLLLLQIVNIVFSPTLTKGITIFLKHLIAEHHRLFKQLYPSKRLIPKHHFMVHYPTCILKIGPILHTWCMRYEAKHNFFKKQVKSFKNITKTLAKKHQIQMAYKWATFDPNRVTTGPGKMLALQAMDWGYEMAEVLQVPVETNVLTVRWAKHSGIVYRSGLVVCVTVHCEMPVFHKIHHVVVQDGRLLLVTFALQTLCLEEHFNAFKIVCTKIGPHVINVRDLLCHKAFDVQTSYATNSSDVFIVPYHFL